MPLRLYCPYCVVLQMVLHMAHISLHHTYFIMHRTCIIANHAHVKLHWLHLLELDQSYTTSWMANEQCVSQRTT
jgi:hypothetical protein